MAEIGNSGFAITSHAFFGCIYKTKAQMNLFFQKYFFKPFGRIDFPFKYEKVEISTDRLKLGIDNVHIDVAISANYLSAAAKIANRLIGRHAKIDHIVKKDSETNWVQERDEFKRLCGSITLGGANQAKMDRDVQIDHIAQMAILKSLIQILNDEFDMVLSQVQEAIRQHESSEQENPIKSVVLKEQLKTIQQQKVMIQFKAGKDMLNYFIEGQDQETRTIREANFGSDANIPEVLMTNPMLLSDNPFNDAFMIEEYDILLGHRIHDPNKYDILLFYLKKLLKDAILPASKLKNDAKKSMDSMDEWINHVDNMDMLLNFFNTQKQYLALKKRQEDPERLKELQVFMGKQKRALNLFYKKLKKAGVIKRIDAFYEIKSIYHDYCPPLNPQQILQFLISRKQRKRIINHIKQLKGFYPKTLELKPLSKKISNLNRMGSQKEKEYLIQFLNGFARFHRDLLNYNITRQVMDKINLVFDKKKLNLSRANNTLYEFMLPHEENQVEKPIINHVIIKADVRGSTDITYRMKEAGLNPASYFSLNFFDPITDILHVYGAEKVFIEGDAIILAITEQQGSPEHWYSVARACGLALNMIAIVQQYNKDSRHYELPVLETGVGISFTDASPAFLFDGDQRIMISPAINLADRLSSCHKLLRKVDEFNKSLFNLFVFQEDTKKEDTKTVDNPFIRFNVNGIELNPGGFQKLAQEIDLKPKKININNKSNQLFIGKFPLMSGRNQQLIIREATVPILNVATMQIKGMTDKKYYEVCTHPKLHEFIRAKG